MTFFASAKRIETAEPPEPIFIIFKLLFIFEHNVISIKVDGGEAIFRVDSCYSWFKINDLWFYKGILPCFLSIGERCLFSSIFKALIIRLRVSSGVITSST